MRCILVSADRYNYVVLLNNESDEKEWANTVRYLEDAGSDAELREVRVVSPGELSDLLAPRDD